MDVNITNMDKLESWAKENEYANWIVKPLEKGGGLNCEMFVLELEDKEGQKCHKIVKQTNPAGRDLSRNLGLAREAFFLDMVRHLQVEIGTAESTVNELYKRLCQHIPKIDFAQGNMDTGDKMIIMEKLEATSGLMLFGSHNIPFKSLNLPSIAPDAVKEASIKCALLLADLHAVFWQCQQHHLKNSSSGEDMIWLRQAWIMEDAPRTEADPDQSFQRSMDVVVKAWNKIKNQGIEGTNGNGLTTASGVKIDPHTLSCVNASLEKISWEAYAAQYAALERVTDGFPHTLVHGDFHAGNLLLLCPEAGLTLDEGNLMMVDFEMVGLGSGPQDLAQIMISNVEPSLRAEIEEEVVRCYYNQLSKNLQKKSNMEKSGKYLLEDEASQHALDEHWEHTQLRVVRSKKTDDRTFHIPSFDDVFKEYKFGGAGRWIWFLVYLVDHIDDREMAQFFVDITASFLADHFPSPASVPMPRV